MGKRTHSCHGRASAHASCTRTPTAATQAAFWVVVSGSALHADRSDKPRPTSANALATTASPPFCLGAA
eukprot:5595684-Prymnesium_polylepis.1